MDGWVLDLSPFRMTGTWAEKATEFSLSTSHPGRAVTDSKGLNAFKIIFLFTEKPPEKTVQNPDRLMRKQAQGLSGGRLGCELLPILLHPSRLPRPRAQPRAPRNPFFKATFVENLQGEDTLPGIDSFLLKDCTPPVIKPGNATSLLYDRKHRLPSVILYLVYTAFWSRNKYQILSKPLFVNKNVYIKVVNILY